MNRQMALSLLLVLGLLAVCSCSASARSLSSIDQDPVLTTSTTMIDVIKARGSLRCGVSTGLVGFSKPNADGEWEGFDVDICKAVAAAVLGDSSAVTYIETTSANRFEKLNLGFVDMLSRTTTWTAQRDRDLGCSFAGVNYYDGQAFMVRWTGMASSAEEVTMEMLKNSGVTCDIEYGTTTLSQAEAYMSGSSVTIKGTTMSPAQMLIANSGSSDCTSSDASSLAAVKSEMPSWEQEQWVILPELLSKEPLSPVTREDDSQFSDMVRFCLMAMINAEEMGITSRNMDWMMSSGMPGAARLLGGEGIPYGAFGVDNMWAKRVIEAVGNYGESFEKHLKPLGLSRGNNALWTDGGLHYGIPI